MTPITLAAPLWLHDDPNGLAQSGGLLGLLQRHGISHGLIEVEGVVLGRDVLGHQDKASETLSLGLVAVFALVARGVDLDFHKLVLGGRTRSRYSRQPPGGRAVS